MKQAIFKVVVNDDAQADEMAMLVCEKFHVAVSVEMKELPKDEEE